MGCGRSCISLACCCPVSVDSGASPAFLLQPGALFPIAEGILASMDPSQPLYTSQASALVCKKAATPFLFVPIALPPPLSKAPSFPGESLPESQPRCLLPVSLQPVLPDFRPNSSSYSGPYLRLPCCFASCQPGTLFFSFSFSVHRPL